jgi:hypothetical protein
MNLRTLEFTATHTKCSVFYVFIRCLVTALNAVDSSASVSTSSPPIGCLIVPHGRNYWPPTPSRIWPPLATARYRINCLGTNYRFRFPVHSFAMNPTENTASNSSSILVFVPQKRGLVALKASLCSHFLAKDVFFGCVIPAFSSHVTVF